MNKDYVYVVKFGIDYEGERLVSIHKTEDGAKQAAEKEMSMYKVTWALPAAIDDGFIYNSDDIWISVESYNVQS